MKSIDPEDLRRDGYYEDTVSMRRFERRYAPITIPSVIGFAFGFYLIMGLDLKIQGLVLSLICLVVIACTCGHAYFAVPKSAKTGLPMERYKRLGGNSDESEFIYVDHSSRTFCRRAAVIRGS